MERKANPDLATREGLTASNLASNGGYYALAEVIDAFSSCKSINTNTQSTINAVSQFTEVDNILMGLNLSSHVEKFRFHGVGMNEFLCLTEKDLTEIGVKEIGSRKKIKNAVSDILKREFEQNSLGKFEAPDRRSGIELSAPDAVALTANMAEHILRLAVNVKFVSEQISKHPQLLTLGKDVAGIDALLQFTSKAESNVRKLDKRVKELRKVLAKHEDDPKLRPVDRIQSGNYFISNNHQSQSKLFKLIAFSGIFVAASIYAAKIYFA